jgi:hypothetical protein
MHRAGPVMGRCLDMGAAAILGVEIEEGGQDRVAGRVRAEGLQAERGPF